MRPMLMNNRTGRNLTIRRFGLNSGLRIVRTPILCHSVEVGEVCVLTKDQWDTANNGVQ
jgi:hypothetical protein